MAELDPVPLEEYLQMHPADLADRLQRLPLSDAQALLSRFPQEKSAAALAEAETENVAELVADFSPKQLAGLLPRMAPQKAVDVLQELPANTRREVLAALPAHQSASLRSLLRYPEDTAGGIMSNRFIALREDMTLDHVREMLASRGREDRAEDVAYLYVTDTEQRLVGIVSLRDLIFRTTGRSMNQIMNRNVKCVRVDADQEELAREFEHYHYLGLPVLDAEGRLVGVVKASDAMEIARKEATEDMQLMVGLSGEERSMTP